MEHIDKQSWLKRMGLESWQPELVISGVVFLGSLSIPGLLNGFGDYVLANFLSKHHYISSMALIYTNVAAFALIGIFGLHLAVRLMWVAMVGLNSVFPEGIIYEKIQESEFFKESFKKDNPNSWDFAEQLDDFSSILFAFSCSAATTFLGINIMLLVAYLAASVFISLTGLNLPPSAPATFAFGFLMFYSLVPLFICKVLFKNKLWAQKLYYYFSKSMALLVGFGVVPGIYSYVYYTFSSNVSQKKTVAFTIVFSMLITLFGGIFIGLNKRDARESLIKEGETSSVSSNRYHTYTDYYEKSRPLGHRILWPVIPNDIIDGPFLKVFVPYFADERSIMLDNCPTKDEEGDKCFVEQLRKFYTVAANDSTYNEPYTVMKHSNANEKGFITVLSSKAFKDGQNIVTVRRIVGADTSVVTIPFWFSHPSTPSTSPR